MSNKQMTVHLTTEDVPAKGAAVINLGLIENAEKAFQAGQEFRKQDVDIIFLCVTTNALSSTR